MQTESTNANLEKVAMILQLFQQGVSTSEVCKKMGYKHSQSLSRFMKSEGYRWDNSKKNYYFQQTDSKQIEEQASETAEVDIFELLEDKEVKNLLLNAKDFLKMAKEMQQLQQTVSLPTEPKPSEDKNIYSLYRTSQKYVRTNSPSVSKSFRIPLELEQQVIQFVRQTGLIQKQIFCLALEEFFSKYQHEFEQKEEEA